jgi:hypothetical protein
LGYQASISGALEKADNNFTYLDRNHTPYNLEDDHWVRRSNSEFAAADLSVVLSRATAPSQTLGWSALLSHSQNAGGLPGDEGQVTHSAGFSGRRDGTQARVIWEPQHSGQENENGLDENSLEIKFGSLREENGLHFTNEDGLSWTLAGDSVEIRNRSDKLFASASWVGGGNLFLAKKKFERAKGNLLTSQKSDLANKRTLFSWEIHSSLTHENLRPLETGKTNTHNPRWENTRLSWQSQIQGGWALTSQWELKQSLAREWRVDASEGGSTIYGEIYEPSHESQGVTGFQTSLFWKGLGSYSAYVRGGRFAQAPSLNDRYGGRYGLLPNPKLKPEKGWTAESGLRWAIRQASAELVGYYTRAEDLVIPISSAGFLKPVNVDAAQIQGWETHFHWGLGKGFQTHAQGTWQKSINRSDTYYSGRMLPDEPTWEIDLKLISAEWMGFRLEPIYHYRSEIFRDPGNLRRIPSLHLYHLHGSWKYRAVAFHLWFQNLSNAFYEDAYSSFPYPGRQIHFTLEAAL